VTNSGSTGRSSAARQASGSWRNANLRSYSPDSSLTTAAAASVAASVAASATSIAWAARLELAKVRMGKQVRRPVVPISAAKEAAKLA